MVKFPKLNITLNCKMHYPLYFQMKCGKNPKDCHLICIFRNTVLGMVILGMFSLFKRKNFISMFLYAKIMDHEDNADGINTCSRLCEE